MCPYSTMSAPRRARAAASEAAAEALLVHNLGTLANATPLPLCVVKSGSRGAAGFPRMQPRHRRDGVTADAGRRPSRLRAAPRAIEITG
jgi:hypothetical protein